MEVLLRFSVLSTIFLSTVVGNDIIDDHNGGLQSRNVDGTQVRYFERDWSATIPDYKGQFLLAGKDTPTKLSSMMLKKKKPNTVKIIGKVGSGKTEALNKIKTELLAGDPNYQVKMIDLDKAIPKKIPHDWNPKTSQFGEEMSKFINGPDKVIILVDNIDRVPVKVYEEMVQYFDMFKKSKKIKVVITATDGKIAVPSVKRNEIIIQIPDMTFHETRSFLTSEWTAKFGSNNPKINEYAFATAKVLKETMIPRTFEAMKQLANLLFTKNKNVFMDENFMSVKKYVKSDKSHPLELVDKLKTMKLNKFKLMNKLIASSVKSADYYGLKALELEILAKVNFGPESSPNTVPKKQLNNLLTQIKDVILEGDLKFLKQTETGEVFQSSQHEKFFAAKYIINQIKSGSSSVSEIVKSLLENPDHVEVIEYINSALMKPGMSEKFKPIFEAIVTNPPRMFNVLDTALSFGFDEISSSLIKNARSPQDYKYYFTKYDGKFVEIFSRSNYKFGMLSTTKELGLKFRRAEVLLQHNMKKTVRLLVDAQKSSKVYSDLVWTTSDWLKYLKDIPSAQQKPKLVEYAIENLPKDQLTRKFLNGLISDIVEHAGFEDKNVLSYLKENGANPSEINVNGETLVHMAVEKGDFEALKFVVEKLRVRITDTTSKSLLITLLDTNPTSELLPPDFWRKAQYLVSQGELTIPPSNDPAIGDVKNIQLTAEDLKSRAYELLTRSADRNMLNEIALEIKTTPTLWDELSEEDIRDYRRNRMLTKHKSALSDMPEDPLTMTEIFLDYRGPNSLSPHEQFSYEAAIRAAFHHDISLKSLTPRQIKNIWQSFRNNLATREDVEFTRKFFEEDALMSREVRKIRNMILLELDQWRPTEPVSSGPKLQKHTLQNEFALTRRELYDLGEFPVSSGESTGSNKNSNQVDPALEESLATLGACHYIF